MTIVDERRISAFRDALLARQVTQLQALGRIRGFNINGGRPQELGLYTIPR